MIWKKEGNHPQEKNTQTKTRTETQTKTRTNTQTKRKTKTISFAGGKADEEMGRHLYTDVAAITYIKHNFFFIEAGEEKEEEANLVEDRKVDKIR